MIRYSVLFIGAAALVLSGATVSASDDKKGKKPEPLTITMSANFTGVKSDVIVRMRVEPDPRSRELTVEWIADDLSGGSHLISLQGDRAAATHHYPLRRLAPGNYIVAAILRRSDGTIVRRESFVSVVGAGGPETFGVGGAQGAASGPAAGR